jgi:transposase InsO family protein
MSKNHELAKLTIHASAPNSTILALAKVGNGPCWTIANNYRFRVPRELTMDNGKQFDYYSFKEYYRTLRTQAKFSSVYHPQSNGAVERANDLIFSGIKKCLFDQKKGKWTDELPKVIWSHNTTVESNRLHTFSPTLWH